MNSDSAIDKMRELMLTIDSLTRFSNIRRKFPLLLLITLGTILISVISLAIVYFYDFYSVTMVGYIQTGASSYFGGSIFSLVIWAAGMIVIYLVMVRAYRAPQEIKWDEDLKEGPLGIIKIMQKYDWEKILVDLRYAKQGFILVSILQLLLYFFLTFFFLFLLFTYLVGGLLQVFASMYYVAFSAAIITLILGDKTLVKLYNRIWSANVLIDELRRFRIEFSQREL
jgi:hypothetical protein